MLRFVWAAALAFWLVTAAAVAVMAGEYQCQRNGSALRLAVEVQKTGHTLPCEVVVEDDRNERAVLYSAQYDRNYCPERLEKTRAEVESEGWSCQKTSNTNIVRGTSGIRPPAELAASETTSLAAPGEATITDTRSCRLGDDVRRLRIEVEDPRKGTPCDLIYWSESDLSETGQHLWRAEHDADFCTKRLDIIVQKWTGEGWRCNADEGISPSAALPKTEVSPEVSAEPAVATVDKPSNVPSGEVVQEPTVIDAKLQAIIEADAKRIGEWMEVEPDIEVAAHGDLNADGRDDAVVFLAYQSEQAIYRQYLMSYLVADETYELAGVKLLTGVNPPPAQARVEQIDRGIIWLSLSGENGTRQKPTGYALRNQQLVEVDPLEQAESTPN